MYEYNANQEFPKEYEKNKSTYRKSMNKFFYKSINLPILNNDSPDKLNVITVFIPNNHYKNDRSSIDTEMLKNHVRLIHKYISDDFKHTVFYVKNNKCNIDVEKICDEYGSSCIVVNDLWEHEIYFMYGYGTILNYIYNEYIINSGCRYVGFIDPGCFLSKRLGCKDLIDKYDCFGRTYDIRFSEWYLWAGFSFYNTEKFRHLDFSPKMSYVNTDMDPPFYDAGGRNYFLYLSSYNRYIVDITMHNCTHIKILKELDCPVDSILSDDNFVYRRDAYIEVFNNYSYFWNAYEWIDNSNHYIPKCKQFLEYVKGL